LFRKEKKARDIKIKYSGRRCAVCGTEKGYLYKCEECGEILCRRHKNKKNHECDPSKLERRSEKKEKEGEEKRRAHGNSLVAESVPGHPGVIRYRRRKGSRK